MKSKFWLIQFLITVVCCLCFVQCGGGSKGTGAIELNGKVLTNDGEPIANATVFLAESGDSATTDTSGAFTIESEEQHSDLTFQIVSGELTTSANVAGLPSSYQSVYVIIKVNSSARNAEVEELVVDGEKREPQGGGASPTPRLTATPSPSPSISPMPTASESPQPTASETPEPQPTSQNPGGSATSTPTVSPTPEEEPEGESPQEGEDAEAEGTITAMSSNSMTVRAITFTLSASTRFRSEEAHQNLMLSDFAVGDQVHVTGVWRNGEAVAETVLMKGE